MLGRPARCAKGTFGYMGPLPRAGRHGDRTRLGEMLVVQLTKFSALSPFGSPRIARSDARLIGYILRITRARVRGDHDRYRR